MLGRFALFAVAALCLDDCAELIKNPGGSIPDPGDGTLVCEPDVRTIFAGRTIDAGTVSIANTETDLVVTMTGEDGWKIGAWHIYAGTGPVPTNRGGNPAPGQFPYHQSLHRPLEIVAVSIPLDEIAPSCDSILTIAIHTEMVKYNRHGSVVARETGWAEWDVPFSRQWGGSLQYGLCCPEQPEPEPDDGCVRYLYYWRDNPDAWPVEELTLGSETYSKEELHQLLDMNPALDDSVYLAQQVIVTKLNEASGALLPPHIVEALAVAEAWFDTYSYLDQDGDGRLPYRLAPGTPEGDYGLSLKWPLFYFNVGREGVPECVE